MTVLNNGREEQRWLGWYRSAVAGLLVLITGLVGWVGKDIAGKVDAVRIEVARSGQRMDDFNSRVSRTEADTARNRDDINSLSGRTTTLETIVLQPIRRP